MESLAPGRDIGKYRVVRRLATGGMAEIYLAQSRGIEGFAKYVVLKRILPQFAASETFVKLFLNEARVTATLDHPNIASVYDIGAVDGVYFFAMEYLHGEDLGHVLRELVGRAERIPLEVALTIGLGVAAGLHAAHEKRGGDGKPLGIVHRDVSPSNVVVTFDGGVKLVDFGVAKLTAQSDLTRTGTLKGKVSYMSPEQCNNDPIDRRSDVFALGVLLYELTTQTRLFRADSEAGTLKLVLDARIPPPSTRVADYPADLEPIILRALARDREQRFATARDLQLAIEDVARARGLVASTAALGEWMVATFGPKLEPWITPPASVKAAVENSESEPTHNMVRRQSLDREPALRTLAASSTEEAVVFPTRRRPLLIAAAMVGIAALAAVAVHGLTGPTPQAAAPPAAVAGPAVAAGSPPLPTTAPASGENRAAAPASPVRRSAGRRASGRPLATEPRPERFSAAFARKESELLRCFTSFPAAASHAPSISVRFHVDLDGGVSSAEVLPPEVATTALGRCVSQVARAAQFGPQPTPATVRIPVSVRRVSQGEPSSR